MGVAIVMLGIGIGFSSGIFAATTAVAQEAGRAARLFWNFDAYCSLHCSLHYHSILSDLLWRKM
ncbi:MAG: hypothetical protein ACLTBV_19910 [Enterocloster bolteae]